jgi:ribosomal-protein-alanine N-acetyltransferase
LWSFQPGGNAVAAEVGANYRGIDKLLDFAQMDESSVRAIVNWRYRFPFDFYNIDSSIPLADLLQIYLDPVYQFHRIHDEDSRLVGFCSFGQDGQVPGGDYSSPALDIGLGMHPDLTGQGRGGDFFAAILQFATEKYEPATIRVNVADFNIRATRVYANAGFTPWHHFLDERNGVPFTSLIKRL